MKVGKETPIQVGMVCAEEDYAVLKKFKKYFIPAMNAIASKKVVIKDSLPSENIDAALLDFLRSDVVLMIVSVDLLYDNDFMREETGLADMLLSQIDRNPGSVTGIYILARNVDTAHIPQPKNERIMILPLNQLPLNNHENEDDAYIMLCKHIALEIQHLRDIETIKRLEHRIKRLEQEK